MYLLVAVMQTGNGCWSNRNSRWHCSSMLEWTCSMQQTGCQWRAWSDQGWSTQRTCTLLSRRKRNWKSFPSVSNQMPMLYQIYWIILTSIESCFIVIVMLWTKHPLDSFCDCVKYMLSWTFLTTSPSTSTS